MRGWSRIVPALLNIACLILLTFQTCFSKVIVYVACIISIILIVCEAITSRKNDKKIKGHDDSLSIKGDDVEE